MEIPKIPIIESQRLRSLQNLNILETPLQENFERITRITKSLFDVPIVAFTLVDENRQWFKSIQGLDVCETPREVSFCGHVIYQGKLIIVNDTLLDTRFADNPLVTGEPGIRFYAGYPVSAPTGEKVGSLCIIDLKPRNFSAADLDQLIDMAKLLEAELTKKHAHSIQQQLNEELSQVKRLAYVDGLTRLWNRAGIEELLRKQIANAEVDSKNFTIALIDIDNFKIINDTHGHCAGDNILRVVAKRLLAGYKESHVVGRWGGEEFLVIMNDDLDIAVQVSEHAKNTVSATPIIFENLSVTVTITSGISQFKWNDPSEIISLISDADAALYEGKREGKNIVKVSLHISK